MPQVAKKNVRSWNRTSGSSDLRRPQRSDLTPNRYGLYNTIQIRCKVCAYLQTEYLNQMTGSHLSLSHLHIRSASFNMITLVSHFRTSESSSSPEFRLPASSTSSKRKKTVTCPRVNQTRTKPTWAVDPSESDLLNALPSPFPSGSPRKPSGGRTRYTVITPWPSAIHHGRWCHLLLATIGSRQRTTRPMRMSPRGFSFVVWWWKAPRAGEGYRKV
jgi:hypothetical protein